MWGRQSIDLAIGPLTPKRSKRREAARAVDRSDVDAELLEELKATRLEAARELEVPAYVIASNKTLEGLAALKPEASDEAWMTVHGIGAKKVEPLRDLFGDLVESSRDAATGEAAD